MRQCLHLNWRRLVVDICIGVVVHFFARGLLASLSLLAMPPNYDSTLDWVVGHLLAQGLWASLPLLAMPQNYDTNPDWNGAC